MFLEGPLKTSKMHVHLHVIAQPNLPVRRLGFFKNSTIPTSEAPTPFGDDDDPIAFRDSVCDPAQKASE